MPVSADAALVPHDVPNRIDILPNSGADAWLSNTSGRRLPHHDHYVRFAAELKALGRPFPRALELGSGPGELAKTVLHEVPGLRLVCLDFVEGKHDRARAHLDIKEGRMTCVTRNFFDPGWADGLGRFDAVIIGPALDGGHPRGSVALYTRLRPLLLPGGIFLMCDRVTDHGVLRETASHMTEDEQHKALEEAGWTATQTLRQGHGLLLLKARP